MIKVSCVMATKDRSDFASKSIKMFNKQSYKNKELVIVDDSKRKDLVTERKCAKSKNMTYIFLNEKHSIGKKRNIGTQHSSGDIIMTWDDDDYNAPTRIENQLNAFIRSNKCMMVYNTCTYYSIPQQTLFKFSKKIHDQIWRYGYLGCSLMFYKTIWKYVKFPNVSFQEDIMFIENALQKGFTIATMNIPKNDFVYVKHINSTMAVSIDFASSKKRVSLSNFYKGKF